MDTRLLRSFLAVVDSGGITAAAARLAYVQSTVTSHVQALEQLAGTTLLDRHAGGATPTAAGLRLAAVARQILDLEERMLADAGSADREPAGPVRLHAPESVCAYSLPRVLRALREHHPGIHLSLSPAATRDARRALAERRADLALLLEPSVEPDDGLAVVDLGPRPLSLLAAADTDLPRHRALTRRELVAAGPLLLEEGCGYSDEFAAQLGLGGAVGPLPRFGGVETVKRCVEAGLGIALLPTGTVEAELAGDRLVELTAPPVAAQHLWLVRGSARWMSAATRAVLDLLVAELRG
jgi:DNA-binding transcriptional LysR family regulator